MSVTREAIETLSSRIEGLSRVPPPRRHPLCLEMAQRVETDAPPEPLRDDYAERLLSELRAACAEGGPRNVPRRLMRNAPLVFWRGTPPAIAIPGLLEEYGRRVVEDGTIRTLWLRTMIEAWLRDFDSDGVHVSLAGRMISSHLQRSPDIPFVRFWLRANTLFGMFDAREGPRRLGQALLSGNGPQSEVLGSSGMSEPLRAHGGFFRSAIVELLSALPSALQRPNAEESWRRAADVLETRSSDRDARGRPVERSVLRFGDLAAPIAEAALQPWVRGVVVPAAPAEAVKGFLLRNMDDPRLNAPAWTGVSPPAVAIMRSWLARDSLEAFLSLIGRTNADLQWRYREAFWRACFGRVENVEVWIVLGKTLARTAARISGLNGSHGHMESPADQAVLLIRIRNLVLSEWSNVGPVRAWTVNDRSCPPLYRSAYAASQLQGQSLDFPNHPRFGNGGSFGGKGLYHHQPAKGLWQGCAAALLRNTVGVDLRPADYMP